MTSEVFHLPRRGGERGKAMKGLLGLLEEK